MVSYQDVETGLQQGIYVILLRDEKKKKGGCFNPFPWSCLICPCTHLSCHQGSMWEDSRCSPGGATVGGRGSRSVPLVTAMLAVWNCSISSKLVQKVAADLGVAVQLENDDSIYFLFQWRSKHFLTFCFQALEPLPAEDSVFQFALLWFSMFSFIAEFFLRISVIFCAILGPACLRPMFLPGFPCFFLAAFLSSYSLLFTSEIGGLSSCSLGLGQPGYLQVEKNCAVPLSLTLPGFREVSPSFAFSVQRYCNGNPLP